ncbi:cell differentiation protein [Theileria orientalis strain Shintoku]|uniref:Cell differentiation protein n=1 Tax=Theileria orientalis strain Shintoku TaxID=869250 RepID=J4C853_THEOR|nr:cell differentiation protein [Theileria orientalis strain Shintoku]BAM40188.1 cell differentiation protein [Theileria orientalis strain Shintoku]|eukprot:XP_009690489.1 cell differentiation protein [Theileria orientalis strain Shintoku]
MTIGNFSYLPESSESINSIHTDSQLLNHQLSIVSTSRPVSSQIQQTSDKILPHLLHQLILDLSVPEKREYALIELSKQRENYPDLAILLWHSFGTVATLLYEIVSVYHYLYPLTISMADSTKASNSLSLLQCIASHPHTRHHFLSGIPLPSHQCLAHIPLFLYPFLNTASKSRRIEYLKLTCLGVIGALVKSDDEEVIVFLLETEIIPLCLRIMETGSDISKTVSIFIVQKILMDDRGLAYVCATAERFYAVTSVLNNMVLGLLESPSRRILKHIVRSYLRLSDNTRARDALRKCLPEPLRKIDPSFYPCLKEEPMLKKWLLQLICNTEPIDESHPM